MTWVMERRRRHHGLMCLICDSMMHCVDLRWRLLTVWFWATCFFPPYLSFPSNATHGRPRCMFKCFSFLKFEKPFSRIHMSVTKSFKRGIQIDSLFSNLKWFILCPTWSDNSKKGAPVQVHHEDDPPCIHLPACSFLSSFHSAASSSSYHNMVW